MHHDKYPDVPENDCIENVRILCRDCHQFFHDYKNGGIENVDLKVIISRKFDERFKKIILHGYPY